MGSVRIAILAAFAACTFFSTGAHAADYSCQPQYQGAPLPPHCVTPPIQQVSCPPQPVYGQPVPPHCMTPPPPPPNPCQPQFPGGPLPPHCAAPPPPVTVIEEFGGWYIRGDIGMTNQSVRALDNALFDGTPGLRVIDNNFESGNLFGFGVGYKWNSWMRFDLTAEYRGETGFHGMDVYTCASASGSCFNNYTAKKSEWLYLFNFYADLGTWSGVTPFVGAGIGVARIGIHSFRDAGIDSFNSPTLAYADSDYKWNVAYAFHAGLSYEVTKNLAIEFAYRYVYLGTGQSGDIIAYDGTNNIRNPMVFRDIDSHDLKLGVRYLFASGVAQPIMPQQVFQPLMRRF